MKKHLDVIDYLRGYSITTIVIMHLLHCYELPDFMMKVIAFGGAGVHVFILCSGFGLYLSYLNRPLSYKEFLRRRFGRVYWPMAVVCICMALWMAYQGLDVLMPLLGNLLLFKMFVPKLENSMGGQMWFISTITQFYIAWPLIIWMVKKRGGGYWKFLLISLLWSSVVGLLGYSEKRVWNSFFLQYLWEFCLGMKLAELYVKRPSSLKIPKWKYLISICILSILLTGIMGGMGFPWKLYNDIPSLIGYTFLALILYKIGIVPINRFFSYTNKFSYEWYLVHILIFQIVMYLLEGRATVVVTFCICMVVSYLVAMGYAQLWNKEIKR